MPKSKKKKGRKNKKHDVVEEAETTKTTTTTTNPVSPVENTSAELPSVVVEGEQHIEVSKKDELENTAVTTTSPDKQTPSNLDAGISSEASLNATTDSVSINLDKSHTTSATSTPVSHHKKKRFSFLRKKKRSASLLHVNTAADSSMDLNTGSQENVNKVQRASSMSHFGRETPKSRIPLHKFRSGKKKNNLSASCSNVESTSLVLNPGMDNWRMAGLLDTVENSNSVHSLNTSTTSADKDLPTIALVPSFKEKVCLEEQDGAGTNTEQIELKTKKSGGAPVITVEPGTKQEPGTPQDSTSGNRKEEKSEGFVETNIDFEYSSEIHDQNKLNDNDNAKNSDKRPTTPLVEIKMNPKQESSTQLAMHSPTLKDALTDAELYELENDERVVTIRNLEDIVRENKLVMPAEVITNDWLVLNLTTREIPTF